ncbi:MAG: deoxyribose-phosphate aldolase [Actinomycetota bacterium]
MSAAELDPTSLVRLVDHTVLKPEVDTADVERCCEEALRWGVAAVCVNGMWVSRVAAALAGSTVETCSVVGFPLGAMSPTALAAETAAAIDAGAVEIDMVVPIGPLLAGDDALAARAIEAVRAAGDGVLVKAIIESAALPATVIDRVCRLAVEQGADFVKTSTGFHPAGGATVDAVATMRAAVGPDVGVKASGGIRTSEDAVRMVESGASRLGMSATSVLVTGG